MFHNCFCRGRCFQARSRQNDSVLISDIVSIQPVKSGYHPFKTFSVFGLSKAAVTERLSDFEATFAQIESVIEAADPIILVKLCLKNPSAAEPAIPVKDAIQWGRRRLGDDVFSDTGQSMEQVVGALLREKNATLAVAESCTGGLIANLLTDVPGSSDYFLFSAVTYANQAKIKILNVRADTLDREGAVSKQTAVEMALGAKLVAGATYGLSTSGIAGPGGGSADKPVGTVCVGLASPSAAAGHDFYTSGRNRRMNKYIFALTALNVLRKELLRASSTAFGQGGL